MVQDTRELNRAAVLAQLLRDRPTTRKEIAAATGISAPTLTRTVEQLIDQGVVLEVAEVVLNQRGRRPVLLDLNPERRIVAGVDLGASNTRLVLADLLGRPIRCQVTPTLQDATPEVLAAWLAETLRDMLGADLTRTHTVAVGLPGAVGNDGRTVSNAPNLPQVTDPAFLTRLQMAIPAAVTIDNDANMALLGERHFGAARSAPTSVMVTLGAGLGAAISIDGRILRGRTGVVGEFGQLPTATPGINLEHLVTGTGMVARAVKAGLALTSPGELFEPNLPTELTSLRADFDYGLLTVLTAATVACEPDIIVLGGRLATAIARDIPAYEDSLADRLGAAPRLLASELGEFAGAMGGVVAAAHAVYRDLGVLEEAFTDIPVGAPPELLLKYA